MPIKNSTSKLAIVVGMQWGDEGKGKIVDFLANSGKYKNVVRYGGGNNAGHTIVFGGKEIKLHILPSGILNPKIHNIIGTGTVIDALVLLEELEGLKGLGFTEWSLSVASNAHLVLPWHRVLDGFQEESRDQSKKIGTTQRGMGPVRVDKSARRGLRAEDLLLSEVELTLKLRENYRYAKNITGESDYYFLDKIIQLYGFDERDFASMADVFEEYYLATREVASLVANTSYQLRLALVKGENILFEGAQGALLDIDHGTYPFVTSSPCTVQDIFQGAGIPFNAVPLENIRVIGVVKAYSTRIGAGAFPTFVAGDFDERIRTEGKEFGATTGRPRMCAPLDMPLLRYAAQLNGVTEIAITKIDVLSCLNTSIPVGFKYKCLMSGDHYGGCTHAGCGLNGAEAVWASLPPWGKDIRDVRKKEDLPPEAQLYVFKIEEACDAPASFISVGPDREETILC